MEFILAQICGFISLVIMVICVQFKQKSKIVMFNTAANVINTIQYFLLGALTGAICSIINTIRCIVFYIYTKKGLKPSLIVLIIFEITAVVSGIIGWQSGWSIIPIIVSVLFTYALWQDNILLIKIASCTAGLGWSIYDIVVKAFMGAIQQFSQFTSAIIAIILLKRKSKSDSKQTESDSKQTENEEPKQISESQQE